MIIKNGYTVMLCLLLTACSGATLRTNIGSVALNNAVASTVEVYTLAELSRYKYIGLGEVSSTYCRTDVDPVEHVSVDDLKKDLKLQVQKLGGNAIIYYTCGRVSYPGCNQYFECNGEGFAIDM